MMFRVFAVILTVMIWTASAQAQWIHNSEDDPFAKKSTNLAMTAKGGLLAGFRCQDAADLTLIFVIKEKVTKETTAMLALANPRMLVIIDDNPRVDLDAEVEITPDGDNYRIEASGANVLPVLKSTSAAKRRFALAIEVMGKTFYSTVFGIEGSSRAIGKLSSGCKL